MEVEVKIRISDLDVLRKAIIKLGGISRGKKELESDYYDFDDSRLFLNKESLRIRNNKTLTLKKRMADTRVRNCEELELAVDGPISDILSRLGLSVRKTTKRSRESFTLGRAVLEIDETSIGNFLEIEASEPEILEITGKLGYSEKDFILETYGELGEKNVHD